MDRELRQHLGRVVRENRKRLGLTQDQLGQRIGNKTHDTISNIERGDTVPSLYTLSALAKVFDIPVWMFVSPKPLVPAPDSMRPAEAAILDRLTTLPDPDLDAVRAIVDVFVKTRGG